MPSSGGASYAIRNPARPGESASASSPIRRKRTPRRPSTQRAERRAGVGRHARPSARSRPLPVRPAAGRRRRTSSARIVTLEQGKALAEAIGEVGRAAAEARFMAGEASRAGRPDVSERAAGVVVPHDRGAARHRGGDLSWNFPVVTPVRKIAPALAFGNTVVFKPSSLTPWSAVYLMELLVKAGVPPGVVNLVTGRGSVVGDALIRDPRVSGHHASRDRRTSARHIYEAAARRLSRVQLELGGKNPAVVIDCEDLDGAAREIVAAAFLCSGQRCTAISRVIVVERAGGRARRADPGPREPDQGRRRARVRRRRWGRW